MTTAQASSSTLLTSDAPERGTSRGAKLYAAYALCACVFFWPTISVMAQTWIGSSAYHHGLLVAPISLWMITRSGALSFAFRPSAAALAGVLGASLVWLVGRAASVNLIEQFGFVSLLIAGAAVVLGLAQFRRLAFPLLFLYFMIPVGGVITPFLQKVTADSAVALLNLTGVKSSIDGLLITTSSGGFEIAEACAGLNFLLAALMVAAIYSWVALRSRRKIITFLVFAAALAIAANIARAYLVILAATLTEGKYSIGADHIVFGWVFYGILLFVLIAVGRRYADADKIQSAPPGPIATPGLSIRGASTITAALAIIMAATAYSLAVIEQPSPILAPTDLPDLNVEGWTVSTPFPGWSPSFEGADQTLHVSYRNDSSAVQLAVGYFAYDRRGSEIAGQSPAANDWRRAGSRTIVTDAFGASRKIAVTTLEDPWGRRLDVATVYWLDDTIESDAPALKLRVAVERLMGDRSRGGVFYIAAPVRAGGRSESLTPFLRSVEPLSAWLARIDAKPSN